MKNETVRVFTKKTDETREQVAEFDIVLPDYYPEVNQILKCSVIPVTESVSFTGDKLGIDPSKCLFWQNGYERKIAEALPGYKTNAY